MSRDTKIIIPFCDKRALKIILDYPIEPTYLSYNGFHFVADYDGYYLHIENFLCYLKKKKVLQRVLYKEEDGDNYKQINLFLE